MPQKPWGWLRLQAATTWFLQNHQKGTMARKMVPRAGQGTHTARYLGKLTGRVVEEPLAKVQDLLQRSLQGALHIVVTNGCSLALLHGQCKPLHITSHNTK